MTQEQATSARHGRGGRLSLFISGIVCGFASVLFYLAEFYFNSKEHQNAHLHDISQHLTIAFAVGLVSIVGIEINARRRAEQELAETREEFQQVVTSIAKNFEDYKILAATQLNEFRVTFEQYRDNLGKDVFKAVLGQVIDKSLAREVHNLLTVPYIKSRCQYVIRFKKPYPGMTPGYCILSRDLSFEVKNVTENEEIFLVYSSYATDEDLARTGFGEREIHKKLTVNGHQPENWRQDRFTIHYKVPLPPGGKASISINSEEPIQKRANRSFYSQSTPTDGLEVVIDNDYPEGIGAITVRMHHPGQAVVDFDGSHYSLRRAFFPGQGFEVVWKEA